MGKYVPSTSEEQQEMLKAVGVSSFDELYTVVPSGMKVDRLAIPEGKSELEVSGIVRAMAAKNKVYSSIFRGAGAYIHCKEHYRQRRIPDGIYPLSGGNQPGNPSVHL